MWNFPLDRGGRISIEHQIALQIELMIQRGEVSAGERLPSVRGLARRLKIQKNTAVAAYRRLKAWGHLQTCAGSGAYLQKGIRTVAETQRDLPGALRGEVVSMLRRGFSPAQVRETLAAWLAAPLPDRVVVVDPALEAAELLAHEIASEVGVRTESYILADAQPQPTLPANSVVVAVPLYWQRLAAIAASRGDLTVLPLTLTLADLAVVRRLAPGSIVLVVSPSSRLLLYVTLQIRHLCGKNTLVIGDLLREREAWLSRVRVADLVIVDAKSGPIVGRFRSGGLHHLRLVTEEALDGLRAALSVPPLTFLGAGTLVVA